MLEANAKLTTAVDVYAFGILMYEVSHPLLMTCDHAL